MSFRIVVEIKVINELGELVDYRGFPHSAVRPWTPLFTEQVMATADTGKEALDYLNKLFAVTAAVKGLK